MTFNPNPLLLAGLALLLASTLGTAFLLRRRKRFATAFVWAGIAGAALALALLSAGIFRSRDSGDGNLQPNLADEATVLARQTAGGRLIGEHLVRFHTGRTVGVVTSPESVRNAGERAMLDGLRESAGARCDLRIVALPDDEIPAGGERLWYPASTFDDAFASLADCAAIVSLAGLPAQLARMQFWWSEAPPPLIIANAQVLLLRRLVASGRIEALLVRRPWVPGENERNEESEQWLLATAQTIAEIARRHPSLFAD